MPKRLVVTLESIAQWDNVSQACAQAAKGKQQREEVKQFFAAFDRNLASVQDAILGARLCQGDYRAFTVHDPKPRIIHAASFSDRIIHHALINCIGERLETSWVDSSYACRTGKGSHRAIEKAAELSRRYPFVVKLDVRAYFATIDHAILLELLARQLKGTGVFDLINTILSSFSTTGTGLPIGALTSQYFANHYLDGFQRWLRGTEAVQAELRYMDDLLLFCNASADAKEIAVTAHQWLLQERRLVLKPAIIQRSHIGVTFCGFKVTTQGIRLGRRRKRSYQQQLQLLRSDAMLAEVSPLQLQQKANQMAALCLPGNHKVWQRKQLQNFQQGGNCIEV